MLRHALTLGTAAAIGAAVLLGLGWIYFLNFSPDRSRYPIRGIDVSHHQGVIDWPQVAANDVGFAVLKATEGGDHVDENFADNYKGARAAGVAIGAYHFFTFCRPGAEQAANFIATVPRDQLMLPPVVDIEYDGNCSARPSASDLGRELSAFLEPVEAAFGQPAIVYLTGEAYSTYRDVVPVRDKWVRWLAIEPLDANWTYWQYHDRGRVPGIEGDVDLNVLHGGAQQLAALLR